MPKIVFYKDSKGQVPVLKFLKGIPKNAQEKGIARVIHLQEQGFKLHRPYADLLRDRVYELRWNVQHVNYRVLYSFYGRKIIVLTHAITKESKTPERDIDKALERMHRYKSNPTQYSCEEEIDEKENE